jgi:hypothetical protein
MMRAVSRKSFTLSQEYNFSSVVAKRLAFLPTIKKLTPHLKDKKCTKKFYTLQQLIGWLKKKEKRRRRKKEEWGAEGVRWSCRKDDQPPRSKSTTGHRDPRLGLAGRGFGFFFFFFWWSDFFFFFFFWFLG